MSNPLPPQGPQGPQQPPRSPSLRERWNGYPTVTKAIVAGVTALVVLCLVCAVCSGLFSALSKGGSTTTTTISQHTSAPSGPTSTPKPPTATPKPKQLTTVQHFTGNGNKSTSTFHIQKGDQIVWSTTSKSSANLFIADLYRQGETFGNDLPYMSIANQANEKSGGDTTTVQVDDADVYIYVQALQVSWTIDVKRMQ